MAACPVAADDASRRARLQFRAQHLQLSSPLTPLLDAVSCRRVEAEAGDRLMFPCLRRLRLRDVGS